MRYFKTSNASRPYRAGELLFSFEPVDQVGGIWFGVLAVEDDSAASSLEGAAYPQVTPISEEEYAALKKKPLSPLSSSRESRPQPVLPESQPSAAPAAAAAPQESPASTEEAPVSDGAADVLAALQLNSARVEPPDELPLAEKKKGK